MFTKELYCKFRYLLAKKKNFYEICSELNLSDSQVMLLIDSLDDTSIYTKLFGEDYKRLKRPPITEGTYKIYSNKEHLRLALLGDTHLCSKSDAVEEIRDAYYIIEKNQTDFVLHCGDFVDGLNPMNKDHIRELRERTYEGQLDYSLHYYPSYSNKTLIVSGNHDDYWYQLTGKEILKDFSERRDDVIYLGANRRKIAIGNLIIDLVHGNTLQNGSIDFKAGLYIRNIPENERPNIVHLGHMHTPYHNDIYGVLCVRTGALMHLSPYHKSKGYNSHISFYFVDVYFDDDGKVKKIKHKKESLDK
ncbi:MAG: metallophosphoesterase family protein [Bacilli bacterium]|nr:metallophosphoesterase family protein [Bacilli bacterium]